MKNTKEILALAVEIADVMLRSGGEIYRIEDTVIHILKTYNIETFDVYVLSNGIFASANENKEDSCSMIRHVPLGEVNLAKISYLNQLARDICSHNCTVEEAWMRVEQAKHLPKYKNRCQMFFCALGSSCYTFLFGGQPIDALVAFFIGAIEHLLLTRLTKRKVAKFLSSVFASFFVATCSIFVTHMNPSLLQDKIIIGGIMPLVPGITFTTSIRDFLNGDYLSGTIHLIDALLSALCIAVGVCLALALFGSLKGGITT